jgi:hypothetical protein
MGWKKGARSVNRSGRAMKVAGMAGFAFFFVKGIVWLAIFGAAAVGMMGK